MKFVHVIVYLNLVSKQFNANLEREREKKRVGYKTSGYCNNSVIDLLPARAYALRTMFSVSCILRYYYFIIV